MRYLDDLVGFVAWWEREEAGRVSEFEQVFSHSLTESERAALVQRDIEALYAIGVHPFLLFT